MKLNGKTSANYIQRKEKWKQTQTSYTTRISPRLPFQECQLELSSCFTQVINKILDTNKVNKNK